MKKSSKKIKLTVIIILLIVIFYIIFANCFNLINNYSNKGYKFGLAADYVGAYRNALYTSINTIIENEDYGTFVIRNNGKFIYYPDNKNLFEAEKKYIYKYEGFWYLSDKLRFTITRTTLEKSGFNLLFKDFEYSCKIHFNFIKDNWFSDNLFINNIEFHPIENITGNEERRLLLDDEIIEKFLKEK